MKDVFNVFFENSFPMKYLKALFVFNLIPCFLAASQTTGSFSGEYVQEFELNYLVHLPQGYEDAPEKHWPLILFLHGAGERGTDIELVKVHGPPNLVESNPSFPFIVISPQCPLNQYWDIRALRELLLKVEKTYRVDKKKVYLTGLSMGGYGTWMMGSTYPELFAAIAPICGGGNPSLAGQLKDTPVWALHGEADNVVPIQQSEEMIQALDEAGGKNYKFTRYAGVGHDSWSETYNNPSLYEWFLSQALDKGQK